VTRRRLLGAALAGAAAAVVSIRLWRRDDAPKGAVLLPHELVFEDVLVFDGTRYLDGTRTVVVSRGRIAAVERSPVATTGAERRSGGVLLPGFVDAHVHLSFSRAADVAAGGVTSVLDLGEPLAYAFSPHAPLRYRAAGPLLTAPGGYPTRSWGANGYGLEVRDAKTARDAVAMLADRGAAIIKVAIEPGAGPVLEAPTLRAIVEGARARKLRVAAHALDAGSVRTALLAGIDVLAHTPVERLPDSLSAELGASGTTVISTVKAFGARASTKENLAALASAGCAVVYGTDLGNDGIRPGIDTEELEILEDALGGREAALAAATSRAGELAGAGGRIAVGSAADLIWRAAPIESMGDLRRDITVWAGGA
jgi:imidazolonepropionase-like amidohydrolase